MTYRNRAGNIDKVKVEINYVSSRLPVLKVVKRKMLSLFETNQGEVNILASEELYGSKIKALVERGRARDIFDVYQIANNLGSIDFEILRRVAIFYLCLELESDFRRKVSLDLFSDLDDRVVRRELQPLLRRGVAFPLEQAKNIVNGLVSRIFALQGIEEEFVEAFYRLDYRPDLLFASNPALKHHPGAAWRLKMLARTQA